MRIFTVLSVIILMSSLCCCTAPQISDLKPLVSDFSCDFNVCDSELSGYLTVDHQGNISLEIKTPERLIGTKISVDEHSISIDTLGLTKSFDKDIVPEYSEVIHLYDALQFTKDLHLTEHDGSITASGTSKSGEFLIHFDDLGYPTSIELSEIDTKINFNNVIKKK